MHWPHLPITSIYGVSRRQLRLFHPLFGVPAGTYGTGGQVSLSNGMANAQIYYTIDGSIPSAKSNLYSGPIPVAHSVTIKAIARAAGYPDSGIASATYTILPPATAPTFSLASGTYTSIQTVSMSDTTSGASIYYTIDGTTPTTASRLYSAPVTVSTTETINAMAVANGYGPSSVTSASYTLNLPRVFSLTALPTSLDVSAGSTGSVNLTVTPQNGFDSTVAFACSGLPAGATCTFNPATVTPVGTSASSTLTLSIGAKSARLVPSARPVLPDTLFALATFCLGWRRRRILQNRLLILTLVGLLGVMSACGGGGGSGAGPSSPAASMVTVTASSGTLQQTVAISLSVR